MTDEQINEAVARKLENDAFCQCGHEVSEHSDGRAFGNGPAVCSYAFCKCEEIELSYSTDIAAAWEIVAEMRSHANIVEIIEGIVLSRCTVRDASGSVLALEEAKAGQAPMAICKAFLKLKGG